MPAGNKRVTLKDVAKAAGVSVGMASRVLSGYGSYSEETAARVQHAAEHLSYRPNMLARSLRLGRSKAIGLVVSYLLSTHWTSFIGEVEGAAARHGYRVLIGTAAHDPDTEREHIRTLHEHHVDGIIASPSPENEELVAELTTAGLPMVLIGSHNRDLGAPVINFDDRNAAHAATEYLLRLGHRRIAMVAGNPAVLSARERLAGYRDALTGWGEAPPEELIGDGNHRPDDAYLAVARLLELPERPTAILVGNEAMAGATLQRLKDVDVSIPDEISLVTFDDPPWAAFYRPSITAVRVPRDSLARLAVDALITQLNGERAEVASETVVPVEFVVRESTRPVG